MKTYELSTTWMYEKNFTVEANSAEEAEQLLLEQLNRNQLTLSDGELLKGSFEIYDTYCEEA